MREPPASDLAVLAALRNLCDGPTVLDVATIAEAAGEPLRTAQRSLARLIDAGMVTRTDSRKRSTFTVKPRVSMPDTLAPLPPDLAAKVARIHGVGR